MSSFKDILDKPASEIQPPKPLPVGTYLCIIDGIPAYNEVGQNKTLCVDFNGKIIAPQEDVDPHAIADMKDGVIGKNIRLRYFLTDDAAFRVKTFLVDHLGIDDTGTLRQMIDSAPGKQVYVKVRHRASQDGTSIFTDVESTAKV